MEEIIVKDISILPGVASELLSQAKDSRIIAFSGDLGSGKTTIIKELCKQLDVEDHASSPTYAIANEYFSRKLQKPVYHIDLYRLKTEEEVWDAGIGEYIHGDNFCFIEWPEIIKESLPSGTLCTEIEIAEDNKKRKLTIFKL